MIDEFEFALKDFKRKKILPFLAFLGIVTCVASTTFLILLGKSMGLTFLSKSAGKLTLGLSHVISTYVRFESMLIFLTGMLVIFFLLSSMMSERIRDIGLIKAIGCIEDLGRSYLMTEVITIVISGCVIGAIVGTVSSIVCLEILFRRGFLLHKVVDLYTSFIILGLSIFLAWFIGAYQTDKALKVNTVNLLSRDIVSFDTGRLGFLEDIFKKLSVPFQLAVKSIFRRRSKSITAVICLSACILLVTVSIVGGFISWYTTKSYIERAFGQDVFVVGNDVLVSKYIDLATLYLGDQDSPSQHFDFLRSDFFIDDIFIERLMSIQGIDVIDRRLLTQTTVFEVQNITIEKDIDDNPYYVVIGDHRWTYSLVVGLDPDHVVSDWFTQEGFLNSNNVKSATIGDSISGEIFENPSMQSLRIFSNNSLDSMTFEVVSVCIDPLNRGYVVYVPFKFLQQLYTVERFNLVLVKVHGSKSETILEIKDLAAHYNLVVSDLDTVRARNVEYINSLWASILPFPLLSVITTVICLSSCMFVSVSGRLHDFGIMRALGAKPNYVAKVVFVESLMFVLLSAPTGILIGLLLDFMFLILGPTLPISILIACIFGLVTALIGMCLLSTLLVIRTSGQPSTKLLQEPV